MDTLIPLAILWKDAPMYSYRYKYRYSSYSIQTHTTAPATTTDIAPTSPVTSAVTTSYTAISIVAQPTTPAPTNQDKWVINLSSTPLSSA